MDSTNNRWNSLSQKEKAEMIKVAVRNGITTLPEIRTAYNEFAKGGLKHSYQDWAAQLSDYWGQDISKHDYDYEKYYNANPEEAYRQLYSILGGGHGHFPDGDENGSFKKPSHPTYPDLGEKSWSNNDTVFHVSDRQMEDSDRILDYLGSDLYYNRGGTKVMYNDGYVLPAVNVVHNRQTGEDEAYSDLRLNKLGTGWVYKDSPDEYAFGGNLFANGGRKNSPKNPNALRAMNYLKSKGLSDTGAAAIVGTLMAESSLDPTIHAKMKGDTGEGLAQWTGSRKKNFWKTLEGIEAGAYKKYGSISNVPFERQLDVVLAERPDVIQAISNAQDVQTATDIMLRGYENGGGTVDSLASKEQMDSIYGKWNNGYDNQMSRRLGNANNLLGITIDPSTYEIPQSFFDDLNSQLGLPSSVQQLDDDPEFRYKPPVIDEATLRQKAAEEKAAKEKPVVNLAEEEEREDRQRRINTFNTVMGIMGGKSPLSVLGSTGNPQGLLAYVNQIYS